MPFILFLVSQCIILQSSPVLTTDGFVETVQKEGGTVNYVFTDDRPFNECHASTLVETADAKILCAWFGGTEEKNPDVAIWLSQWNNEVWSVPIKVAKVREEAHWNPVLFKDQDNIIYLFFKVGKDVPVWSTYWMKSTDNGNTWTEPVELVPGDIGGRGPVKNKPIVLNDGAWLAPASTENKVWRCFADRTTDKGKTWIRSKDWDMTSSGIRGKGVIQPTFWESSPNNVHALMRSTGGRIARCDSKDGGKTWGKVYKTSLPNNNSGIDLVKNVDGVLWLVYNPVSINRGPRNPLTLAFSKDNGDTWTQLAHLENDPIIFHEYSYPSIITTQKGIAISYTWRRNRIKFLNIPNINKLSDNGPEFPARIKFCEIPTTVLKKYTIEDTSQIQKD